MTETHRLPYVVVRYHYDPARDEAVNVGVILQTEKGLFAQMIEDWVALHQAYPFLDVRELRRKMESLRAITSREKIRIFDYDRNEPLELLPNDSRLLTFLRREINHDIELTEQRFAELPAVTEPQVSATLSYLYDTLVDPPEPKPGQIARAVEAAAAPPTVRRAHATLHRAARRTILKVAGQVASKTYLESEPIVTGSTRTWRFDLKVVPAARYIQHILALPDLEETMVETAALARIWQDVEGRHRNAKLTAVYYSENGVARNTLRDGEKLLAKDRIETIYAEELREHYAHLLGQKRLLQR